MCLSEADHQLSKFRYNLQPYKIVQKRLNSSIRPLISLKDISEYPQSHWLYNMANDWLRGLVAYFLLFKGTQAKPNWVTRVHRFLSASLLQGCDFRGVE